MFYAGVKSLKGGSKKYEMFKIYIWHYILVINFSAHRLAMLDTYVSRTNGYYFLRSIRSISSAATSYGFKTILKIESQVHVAIPGVTQRLLRRVNGYR